MELLILEYFNSLILRIILYFLIVKDQRGIVNKYVIINVPLFKVFVPRIGFE